MAPNNDRRYWRRCNQCNKWFLTSSKRAKYCSGNCKDKHRFPNRQEQKSKYKICAICGKKFESNNPNAKVCSNECRLYLRRQRERTRYVQNKKIKAPVARPLTKDTAYLVCTWYGVDGNTVDEIAELLDRPISQIVDIIEICKKDGRYNGYIKFKKAFYKADPMKHYYQTSKLMLRG